MSSPDRVTRRCAFLAVSLLPALMLGGCFRPMYASTAVGGTGLTDKLAAVSIDPVEGRVAQQVRNNLDFGLTGGAGSAPPRYKLHLTVTSSQETSIVEARTNEPQIDQVVLEGDFALTPIDSDTPVLSGKHYARKSFDRTLQRFASVRAARDAENSAAELLAEQIKNRIASYLAQQG